MVEWSIQVKQMQSLWPEWMWHPEMWFTIIPPSPFYQFLSSVCFFYCHSLCASAYFIFTLFIICIWLLALLFLFFRFGISFPILFDPSVKCPLGRPSRSPCSYDWVCCSVQMTLDLAGPHFSLYFFSWFQPYLTTQPRCFSSLRISSCKGQPLRPEWGE